MGNRICRVRRGMVEERYTRPQRLLRQPSNVDYKKLRKLILSEKLAPCFDGAEDSATNSDLEECPICFYFYPSLNRSRCCTKGICTECFLQMQNSAAHPAQCPFCKTSRYEVDYRGAKTVEEKSREQAEEQKVIEAKIRMQCQESENLEQVVTAAHNLPPVEPQSTSECEERASGRMEDEGESDSSSDGSGVEVDGSAFLTDWNQRHAEFGLDLEDIMLMEAIWQSLKDSTLQKRTARQISGSNSNGGSQRELHAPNQHRFSLDSVTGGVAIAIARMAERNILQSVASNSSTDTPGETDQNQDESYSEHQSYMLSTMPEEAVTLLMEPTGSAEDSEFDEARSENYHHSCSSTTEDDNWDSHSISNLDGSQVSEDELDLEDRMMEDIDMASSSCSSSVHSLYNGSCGYA
ncbi:hypothetical protein Syun_025042 [Stephania yunnanensis]|uniref:RING-type domain-containing protein n=1 Tax=Stephania yunnanensis TaxID=152371 RepID=A0AAP0EW88_9MAGN